MAEARRTERTAEDILFYLAVTVLLGAFVGVVGATVQAIV